MKCFLISDNADTLMGMRLAGIDGVHAGGQNEVLEALDKAAADNNTAVIFVTKKLADMCRDEISERKLTLRRPLIVEIPDRHGDSHISETLSRYVSDAVGMKI